MADEVRKRARQCFVMMPLAGEFTDLYEYAIKPTLSEIGYRVVRADEIEHPATIFGTIIKLITESDLIVAEVSKANPNVFYELGIANALGRPVLIVARRHDDIPFDLRRQPYIVYRTAEELRRDLRNAAETLGTDEDQSRSPVAEFLPGVEQVPRSELDAAKAQISALHSELSQLRYEHELLQSQPSSDRSLLGLREEVRSFLNTVSHEILAKSADEVVAARVEAERAKAEVAELQSATAELRKLKQMTLVNPHWKGRDFSVDPDLCFLLMPFREPWSDDVWKLVDGIVTRVGFRCLRADQEDGRVIMDDIWENICRARIVIADLTGRNPNVTYEVGLADVVGKQVVLLSQTPDDVPFDFLGLRLVTYENSLGGARRLSEQLEKRLVKAKTVSG